MPTPAHTNTHGKGKHQKRQSDDAPLPVQSLSFRQSLRNVSSCTRCRQRKTRCDQQLPQCGTCEKAGARCVGYDPLMKREVPRSYLYYLEDRVEYFQNLLAEHGVSFEPGSSTMERSQDADPKDSHRRGNSIASTSGTEATVRSAPSVSRSPRDDLADTGSHLDVDIVRDKHDPGCCPAHELLFALQPSKSLAQSFVLPDRELAAQLITFYFEQGYPQVPALHKGELAQLLNQAYAGAEDNHHYNLFLLHIVFAIGARIMRDRNVSLSENDRPAIGKRKRDTETKVHLAEEYYSAAIAYLSLAFSECDDVSCKLEVIEAAVLIAHLSLFYPTRPGPVYLVGLALRAAVDAKLYDAAGPSLTSASCEGTVSNQDGKQQDQVLQRSRRLWWSAYSLDRLVSPYTGRPFAIPDHLITTAFPSMPEEMGVSCQGISPSNKLMNFLTTHLLQLRQLQSEIHEVLQYHHAQSVRSNSTVVPSTTSILSSPLDYFESFPSWKRDINRRLDEWKSCIPSREETGTWVPIVRLELDYWKTINLLYRHEVKVPSELGRLLPQSHLNATHLATGEGLTDDFTHFKIVEASRKVLQSYRLVHHLDSGNCTFLATHNIFLAGTLFLFAIWNSEMIRNILSLDEIDGTILTGTAVLASMADIHPQARECQDSLERMRVATMQMCLSSSKPGSGASPSKVPTVEVPSSTEDQVQLQPEQDILRGLGNANALTELFPVGDSSDIANANDNVDSIAPLIESQPRYFSNMGLPQTDKDESAFSLDFLDIELFPGRLSNDHGSILGR